jgi:hypothetical protein
MTARREIQFDHVREALRHAAERSSLRSVANAVGLSAAGVLKLLRGSQPRAETRERLIRWYLASAPHPNEPSSGEAREAIRLLLGNLQSDPVLDSFVHGVASMVAVAHHARGVKPPRWVIEVQKEP